MKKKLLSIILCLAMAFAIVGTIAPTKAEAASVKLNKKKVTVYVGDTYQLTLKNAKGDITWKTSKKAVATVKDGIVTAKKAGKATISAKYNGKTYKCKVTVKKAPASEDAFSAVENMKIGWNLGNYLDATGRWLDGKSPKEFMMAWGNPLVDESLFKRLKEMGIGAVRVPVTWMYHFDEEGNIDPEWMGKVKEVVDWVLANDMYCIINVHHDCGAYESDRDKWLFASEDNFDKNNELFSKIWAQIAGEFINYPQELLFEGFNEMLDAESHWADGADMDAFRIINEYNQLFVDTVRKTGGRNSTRNLICNTYAGGNFPDALYQYAAPSDTVKDHIIGQVHFYEPYEFTMGHSMKKMSADKIEEVNGIIGMIAEAFETRGDNRTKIPVIIGEYGADLNGNNDERIKWYSTVVKTAKEYGITCFIWDNGNANEMGLINRTGTKDPFGDVVKACVEAAK